MTTVRLLVVALLVVGAAALYGLMRQRRQAARINERSRELEQLSAELYRANRTKSEFLANVSHELRTPLAAIVGFADLLRDGAYGELSPRQAGPVERIETAAQHLQALVEQVLDLARMSAGRLEVHTETLRLRSFVLDIAAEVEPLLTHKAIAFNITLPATLPTVTTDPTHLRQILVNLLGNAIKFTTVGSVSLRAHVVSPEEIAAKAPVALRPALTAGAWVAVQVGDSGIGIAPADRERIFQEFEQVNAGPRGNSETRGTGLGLAISRRLARLLEGDITVDSVPGTGSTFTLWLPTEPAAPA